MQISKTINFIKENRSRFFWLWITYQAIKGSITFTLVWLPLYFLWQRNGGWDKFVPEWGMFVSSVSAFFVSHIVLTLPSIRNALVKRIGNGGFGIGFGLVSLITFIWATFEVQNAPIIPLWPVSHSLAVGGVLLILFGVMLAVMGFRVTNPYSIFSNGGEFDAEEPGIVALTRHPVLWGVVLWAAGHILANGDVAAVIFFGSQTVFALVGMLFLDRRTKGNLGDENWVQVQQSTPLLLNPLRFIHANSDEKLFKTGMLTRIIIFVFVVVFLILLHPIILGVDPLWWI